MDRSYLPVDQDVQTAVDLAAPTTSSAGWGAGFDALAWAQRVGGGGNDFARSLIAQSGPSAMSGTEGDRTQRTSGWVRAGRFAGRVAGTVLAGFPGAVAGEWLGGEAGQAVDELMNGASETATQPETATEPETVAQAGTDSQAKTEDTGPGVATAEQAQQGAAPSTDTATASTPTAGPEIKGMSQFIWYGFDVRELSYSEALAAMTVVHSEMGIGATPVVNEAPDIKTEGKLDGKRGYWWFDANDRPVTNAAAGGVKYIRNAIDFSQKVNEWTGWMSGHAPGARPGFVKTGDAHVAFADVADEKGEYVAISDAAQNLDLRNIPGKLSCFATCISMEAQVGMSPTRTDEIHGMVTDETYINRKVDTITADPVADQEAMDYLNFETSNGRAVHVGVTYKDSNKNDYFTDHWVIVTKRVGDGQFAYIDPGTGSTAAANSDANVFVWDAALPGFQSSCPGHPYIISDIRPNSGSLTAWRAHKASLQAANADSSTTTATTTPPAQPL